jgi:hypothetical protein
MTKIITSDSILIDIKSQEYPLTIKDLGKRHTTISFGTSVPVDYLTHLGYAVVESTPRINGIVVEEGVPVLVDGVYYQAWIVRDYSEQELNTQLEQKKAELLTTVQTKKSQALMVGQPFAYEGKTYHLQLRSTDVAMITALMMDAQRRLDAGDESKMLVRSYENECVMLSAANVKELTVEALTTVMEIHAKVWAFQSNVQKVKSISELPAALEYFQLQEIVFK